MPRGIVRKDKNPKGETYHPTVSEFVIDPDVVPSSFCCTCAGITAELNAPHHNVSSCKGPDESSKPSMKTRKLVKVILKCER